MKHFQIKSALFGVLAMLCCLHNFAYAVDESRARQLLAALERDHMSSSAEELLFLVEQTGWQDLNLLERSLDVVEEYAFSLPRGDHGTAIRTRFGNLKRFEYRGQSVDAEQVVRIAGGTPTTYSSFDGILLEAEPTASARIKIIQFMRRCMHNQEDPLASVLPGPKSMGDTYRSSWERRPFHLAGYMMLAPEWKVIGSIELMAELDVDPTVRAEATRFMQEWNTLISAPPQGLDEDFEFIWQATIENYRERTPSFVEAMRIALFIDRKPLLRPSTSSELARAFQLGADGACRSATGLLGVPTVIPAYLDVYRLPELRANYN